MKKRKLSATEKLLLAAAIVFALITFHEQLIEGVWLIIGGIITLQQDIDFTKTSYDSVIDLKESKKLASEIKSVFPSDTILYKICADEDDGQTTTQLYVRYRNDADYAYGQEELSVLYACILDTQSIFNSHIDYQTCQNSDYIEVIITNRRYMSLPEETCFKFELYKKEDGQFDVHAVQAWQMQSKCDLFVLAGLMDVDVLYYNCSESTAKNWDEELLSQLTHLEKLYLYIYDNSSSRREEIDDEELRQFIENSLPDCEIIWGNW